MERKIEKSLLNWRNSAVRKPLLLQGARQVGKTFSALSFGKKHYKNCVYFNFEGSTELAAIFERDLNPERILKELAAKSMQTILKKDTLIIFDEIQSCPKALTALKYFCEEAPEYPIIAAGSLLGVAIKEKESSFPVGKVDMLTMYPLDFEEFLWAIGQKPLANLIRSSFQALSPLSLHETALEWYRTYLVVGGMPEAVNIYAESGDYDFVLSAQHTLDASYIADMAKYTTAQEMVRNIAAWRSIPAQLAKDNHKFQYKIIKSGARAKDYSEALNWLESAGILYRCALAKEGKMPLYAYADVESFKVYMVDTGLLCSKFDIAPAVILNSPHSFDGFKGALAENYIMQSLVTDGLIPYYWASQGKAEVDFVFQNSRGDIIPLEAKSADNVRSRSLKTYCSLYKPPFRLRVSARNFGKEETMVSIPLYAMFCLDRDTAF